MTCVSGGENGDIPYNYDILRMSITKIFADSSKNMPLCKILPVVLCQILHFQRIHFWWRVRAVTVALRETSMPCSPPLSESTLSPPLSLPPSPHSPSPHSPSPFPLSLSLSLSLSSLHSLSLFFAPPLSLTLVPFSLSSQSFPRFPGSTNCQDV